MKRIFHGKASPSIANPSKFTPRIPSLCCPTKRKRPRNSESQGRLMIPFQLHRRIPLIRRPFWQRDLARQEAQELRDRAAGHEALIASLKTQIIKLEGKSRNPVRRTSMQADLTAFLTQKASMNSLFVTLSPV
jgi:hypothetical protein